MDAVECGAPHRKESARRISYRHQRVAHQACDARDHSAAQRPVHRRAAGDVAAADRQIGAVLDRLHQRTSGVERAGGSRLCRDRSGQHGQRQRGGRRVQAHPNCFRLMPSFQIFVM